MTTRHYQNSPMYWNVCWRILFRLSHHGKISSVLILALSLSLAAALPVFCASEITNAVTKTEVPSSSARKNEKDDLEKLLQMEVPNVYGASKTTQKITEAPSSVTVISSDEIKRYGYRTLGDMLQSVQGMHVSYNRNHASLGIRGLSRDFYPNSRVLVLVDGHRINNNLYDGAFIGTDFILDMDLVDRVEIIRGPGSVLYGNNAFMGVVNVIPKQGRHLRGVEASVQGGSFDSYKGRVTLGHKWQNDVELYMSGTLYDYQGPDRLHYYQFDKPGNNGGVARDMDSDTGKNFFGKLVYGDLSLQGAWMSREKLDPTAPFGVVFNDSRHKNVDDRAYTALQYIHEFPDICELQTRVYYDRGDFSVDYPIQLPGPKGTVIEQYSREENMGEWWGAEIQLQRRFFDKHALTLGGEYRDDFNQERSSTDLLTGLRGRPSTGSRQTYSSFLQAEIELHRKLHLNSGIRYDYLTGESSVLTIEKFKYSMLNPRQALIYNPWEASTFKAIYGTAFRAPTFLEAINRAVKVHEEKIRGYELVYEQGIGAHMRLTLSGFMNEMKGTVIIPTGGSYFNAPDAIAKGIETGVEGFWGSGLRGRASYTFTHTRDDASGGWLTDAPQHMGKFNISAPVFSEKLIASLETQVISSRLTLFGTKTPTYGIVNLNLLSQNLTPGLEISAGIYNLLDQRYYDPSTPFHSQDMIVRDGRTFLFKLSYRF